MSNDLTARLRGMIRRVTLKNVKDEGESQTASIEVADGIWRDDVEVLQQYGVASHPPEDGALAVALALGGDEGDIVLLPVGNPSSRMGGLKSGDSALYNKHGDRVVVRAGGGIEIFAAASVTLKVGGVSMTISDGGVAIAGGKVTHDGKNIGSDHVHGGIVPGSSDTDVPSN